MVRIETQRLIIRSLKREDEQSFIRMASDGSLWEIFGDCSECDRWMGKWIGEAMQLDLENNPTGAYLAYAIECRKDHKVAGSVGCSWYEDLQRVGITYFMDAGYRGHGYMTEAVKGYTQYFFRNYAVSSLFATARTENAASCRVLEKAGFCLFKTGMYQDMFDKTPQMSRFYELAAPDAVRISGLT